MRSSGSLPADLAGLKPGRMRYSYFTNEQGGILDDLMVVNCGDHLLLVVNGACKDGDYALVADALGKTCTVEMLDRALDGAAGAGSRSGARAARAGLREHAVSGGAHAHPDGRSLPRHALGLHRRRRV